MNSTFLSRFTPSLMSPEALEAIFVQREKLAERQVDLIRDSSLNRRKHYSLLIGPRGIGKTHLVSIVYHRVRALEELKGRLAIAWLREEEWGVASFLDLLLRICLSLKHEEGYEELEQLVQTVYEKPDEGAVDRVRNALDGLLKGRTLLIVLENFDEVLDGLGPEGQMRLRAFLQENPVCTILATSPSLFDAVSLRTSPFYGFFRITHLESLSVEEATRLLEKLAMHQQDRELAAFIATPTGRARIRSLHHLAGGNHRVYIIFSHFLSRASLDDLVEPFMRTLDDLTPYYQERIRWLSPQQRRIIEFLCDARHAVSVKEIAKYCLTTHQTVSSQLKDLRGRNYVRNEMVGRESYYELSEPLMRLCVELKKNRGEPIRLFVDFLRLWYTREELEKRLALLHSGESLEREYVMEAIRVSREESGDPRVAACWSAYSALVDGGDFSQALDVAEELIAIRGESVDWFQKGYCLNALGRYEEALSSYDRSIHLEPEVSSAWNNRGATLANLGRLQEALECYDEAIKLDPESAFAWGNRGIALGKLERYEEELECLDKAISLSPKDAGAWYGRGNALRDLGRYTEALGSYDRAIGVGEGPLAWAWLVRGETLEELGRDDEALESYTEAVRTEPGEPAFWMRRGIFLDKLGRGQGAAECYEKAIEAGREAWRVHLYRARELVDLHRWEEGIGLLEDALNLFAESNKQHTEFLSLIVCLVLTQSSDPAIWRKRVQTLLDLYKKHKLLLALGQDLVQSILHLKSDLISDSAARTWRDMWQELASRFKEFEVPLRLLDAAVRYVQSEDQRVLLGLPAEERSLLTPLLEA